MIIAELHKTSQERYTVRFEDGGEVKTTLGVITDLRLFQGKDLSQEQIEELKTSSARHLTLERSIEMLSRRQMSGKELRDKLLSKGIDEDTAEYCKNKLFDMGLMDDGRYAQSLARHYSGRGYGVMRVRQELARRGIAKDLWDEAIAEMESPDEKIDKIIKSKLTDSDDREQVKKITAMLYRRGYSWDEIKAALRRFNTEPEEY